MHLVICFDIQVGDNVALKIFLIFELRAKCNRVYVNTNPTYNFKFLTFK